MTQVKSHPKLLMVVIFLAIIGFAFLIYYQAISKGGDSSGGEESPTPTETIEPTKSPKPTQVVISTDSDIFPDDNLEIAIRKHIDKPTGTLESYDLDKVTELVLQYVGDLTGLEKCVNLTYLDLNEISEGGPEFDKDGNPLGCDTPVPLNRVTDIYPLVANPGLGNGDIIDLRTLILNKVSKQEYIPELESRGVEVLIDTYHSNYLPDSQIIEMTFSKSWLLEHDQDDHPEHVAIVFPKSWLDSPPEIEEKEITLKTRISKSMFESHTKDVSSDAILLELPMYLFFEDE